MRGQPTRSPVDPGFRCAHPGYDQIRDERRNHTIRLLPRAGAQIPAGHLRRPDRPGRHGAHDRRTRSRPAAFRRPGSSPACAASARPRRRAFWRARSITNCPTARSPARPSQCRCSACIAKRSWRAAISTSSRWTPPPITASTTCAQINDAVRYAPVSARYKVYILDEVHMLSRRRLQRAAQDAGRAAAARQVHLRHHRNPQSADHGAVALPAFRSAPGRCRAAGEASARHRRQGSDRSRAGGAGADRARRRRLGARFAVAVRSGDRARRRASCAPRTCGRCSGLPTAPGSSTCSRR